MIEIKKGQVWRKIGDWESDLGESVTVVTIIAGIVNCKGQDDPKNYMTPRFKGTRSYDFALSNGAILELDETSMVKNILSHYDD